MPIELFGFVDALNVSFPLSSDGKRQGDDHIRGLKQTLKQTFPDASREFRFPQTEEIFSSVALTTLKDNRRFSCKTGSGNLTITLPGGLDSVTREIEVYKSSGDANCVFVQTASGLLNGYTGRVRINEFFTFHKFIWQGTAWHHITSQPPPIPFDYPLGAGVPAGYVRCLGQTLSPPSDFPDILNYYGTTTLPNSSTQIIRMV